MRPEPHLHTKLSTARFLTCSVLAAAVQRSTELGGLVHETEVLGKWQGRLSEGERAPDLFPLAAQGCVTGLLEMSAFHQVQGGALSESLAEGSQATGQGEKCVPLPETNHVADPR